MAKTAAKKGSKKTPTTTTTTVPKHRGRFPAWTDDQVKVLREAVKSEATMSAAFEKTAKELGKSKGTVQQKWYKLNGGAKVKRVSRPSASAAGAKARRNGIDVAALSSDELVQLAQSVQAEVKRRQDELSAAAGLFA